MKSNKYISILAASTALVTGLGLSSCADDLDLKNPDAFDFSSFYETQQQFEGNITAIMNQWRSVFSTQFYYNVGDIRAGFFDDGDYLDGSALIYQTEINNTFSKDYCQFSNYNNMYGIICNINTFIHYAEERSNLFEPAAKNYLLGMVYGMRAYCYFQLHKLYGWCPLELTPDVALGVTDVLALQKKQSPASVIVDQVISDINASLEAFNKSTGYTNNTYNAAGGVYYWTKQTTEMLAGEAYLWFGKVSTLDYTAKPEYVAKAKTYLENVVNNYGNSLMSNYYDVWREKGNKEVIFAIYYDRGETTWDYRYTTGTLFNTGTGLARGRFWWNIANPEVNQSSTVGADKLLPRTDIATRFAYNEDYDGSGSLDQQQAFTIVIPSNQNSLQVKNAFVRQFNDNDQRSDMFIKAYLVRPEDEDVYINTEFDPDTCTMAGAFVYKFPGQNGQNSPYQIVGGNDILTYRLPLAYLYLAECANYEGNTANVAKYINLVRERAYGENWNESLYGYTASTDFKVNEIAILQEKDKEFFQEGQRWWDLRRLQTVKGGAEEKHLIFQPEGCVGYGLDPANFNPNMRWNEVSGDWGSALNPENVIKTNVPVLDYATQARQLLQPLTQSMTTGVNNLDQTPGY